jgi:hypothetical protein
MLTKLLGGLRFVIPIPFWVTEIQLGAVLLSIVLSGLAFERYVHLHLITIGMVVERRIQPLLSLAENARAVTVLLLLLVGGVYVLSFATPSQGSMREASLAGSRIALAWQELLAEVDPELSTKVISLRSQLLGKLVIGFAGLVAAPALFAIAVHFPEYGLSVILFAVCLRLVATPVSESE